YPVGVALSKQGDLFILDGENVRVLKFDRRSSFERTFGGREAGPGRLTSPVEILVTMQDQVLVLEDDRIIEFDFAGNFVRTIGGGMISAARGFGETADGVAVVTADVLWFFDRNGSPLTRIEIPMIVASVSLDPADVAVLHDRVYLLTRESVVAFSVRRGGR
ncbi:MAG: hypothetical protein HY563_09830, partial [Ignavibacteriales bacterium]|nr:hypothetical protein [Ignavibacteriales bacterium]